jgi:hypothetical protein
MALLATLSARWEGQNEVPNSLMGKPARVAGLVFLLEEGIDVLPPRLRCFAVFGGQQAKGAEFPERRFLQPLDYVKYDGPGIGPTNVTAKGLNLAPECDQTSDNCNGNGVNH